LGEARGKRFEQELPKFFRVAKSRLHVNMERVSLDERGEYHGKHP